MIMLDNVKIIQDVFSLYELSLAVGNSLDTDENCRYFLNTLASRKGLSFTAIWIRSGADAVTGSYHLLYALPTHRVEETLTDEDHYILQRLQDVPYFSLDSEHSDFSRVVQEKNINTGVYGIFKLGELGFLKIHAVGRTEVYSTKEMAQLNAVFQKFTTSLEGCLAHEKLKEESLIRKKAQDALQRSNARYVDLFQNMNDVLLLLDADGIIIDANQAAAELTGLDPGSLAKKDVRSIIHPDDLERAVTHFQLLPKQGAISGLELRILSSQGDIKYVQVNSSAIYEEGAFVGSRDIVRDVTRQKKAEKSLLDSEYRLRQIIDTSLDAVITIDGDGKITEWSKQAEQIFGYQRHEVLRKLLGDLIVPNVHRQAHHSGIERFHQTGEGPVLNKRIEISALRSTGEEFPIELAVTPIQYESNFFFSAFVRDISHRKAAEKALRNSQTRLIALIKNLQTGILLETESREIVLVNQTFCDIFGIPVAPESLIGQDCSNAAEESKHLFVNPDQFIGEVAALLGARQLKAGDELETVDGRILVRDFIPIESGENYLGHLWQYRDVTERRQAQRAIQKSEEKYRNIMENMQLGMLELDQEERIVKVYDRFSEMTGYREEELLGKVAAEVLLPPDSRSVISEDRDLRKSGQPAVYEIQIRRKDGSLFWALISGSPIYNDQGKLQGSLALHYDITDRKLLEQDLFQAKQVAEQARRAEQQFLANMSHEIRTPMNAVIGMTYLLYETSINERQKEYLDALRFSADSLLGIINNILDISKIEAGELELEEKTFNLLQMMNALYRTFQFKLREKPVSMVLNYDPAIKHLIIGDATRLNQILINLLGNAGKFTNKGTIGLDVRLLRETPDSYLLEFKVHDTGIGIPTDKLELIFENFKQADLEVVRKFGGTGLGLTIVKQLVEMQQGRIEVQSEPGQGSVFTFVMPFGNSGIPATEKDRMKENTDTDLATLLQQVRLLVVEDNAMNQKLISRILETWGCTYQLAGDGYKGLELASQHTFDVILMDIHMPGIDGCEVTRRIRNDAQNPNQKVPIIALTAAALLDEKNRALESGMNDFLTKPFSPRSLQKKIVSLLGLETPAASTAGDDPEQAATISIDLAYLFEFSNNDVYFVKDMLGSFLTETPIALEQMDTALREKDWEQLYRIAHSLKSNLMMLGMKEQEACAKAIEKLIKEGRQEGAELPPLIQSLRQDTQQSFALIREKLTQL